MNARLLRSKVARRIVLLFVVCALLPVAALAVVAYIQVADELRSASRRRLHTSSKSAGMEIVDRLRRLDAELVLADEMTRNSSPVPDLMRPRLRDRFERISLLAADGQGRAILGPPFRPPMPTSGEWSHLRSGRAVVSRFAPDGSEERLLIRRLTHTGGADTVLAGVVNNAFVFNADIGPLHVDVARVRVRR